MWLGGSRGSQSMGMVSSSAEGLGGGGGGVGTMIVPGPPPSPSKKEPRTDYDSPTLEISPQLEQGGAVAARDEGFCYRG